MEDRFNELIALRNKLGEDILNIKLQLEKAIAKFHLTGEMSDRNWFYNTKYDLGKKRLELKKVNDEFEKLKRAMKLQKKNNNEITKTFEREFMNISKDVLHENDYLRILNLTHERVNKNSEIKKEIEAEEETKVVKGTKWSSEEEKYLEENYKNFTIEELALELNRSENSVRSKIQVIKKKSKKLKDEGDKN